MTGMVHFDANFERINTYKEENGSFKSAVLFKLKSDSFYLQDKKVRMIKKSELSARNLASNLAKVNKDNALASVKVLRNNGYITEDETKKYYIIHEPKGESYIQLDIDFAKELVATKDSNTILVYIYLKRLYDMKTSRGEKPVFTYKDLLKKVFFKNYWNERVSKLIHQSLNSLMDSDLIKFGIMPVTLKNGKETFVRVLFEVNDYFPKHSKRDEDENKAMGGNKEDLNTETEDIDFEKSNGGWVYPIGLSDIVIKNNKGQWQCISYQDAFLSSLSNYNAKHLQWLRDNLEEILNYPPNKEIVELHRRELQEKLNYKNLEVKF